MYVCVSVYVQRGKRRTAPPRVPAFIFICLSAASGKCFPRKWDICPRFPRWCALTDKSKLAINYSNPQRAHVCVCVRECVCVCVHMDGFKAAHSGGHRGRGPLPVERRCMSSFRDRRRGNESHPPLLPIQPLSFISRPCDPKWFPCFRRTVLSEGSQGKHTHTLFALLGSRRTLSWPTFMAAWLFSRPAGRGSRLARNWFSLPAADVTLDEAW